MLKKIVHIVLVLLLTVATTGFTINKHYCGDQFFSVSLFKADKCNCGGQCDDCHTNIKQLKVTDNYSVPEAIHPEAPTSANAILVNDIEFSALIYPAVVSDILLLNEPPPGEQRLYTLFQSFLC